MCIRDSSTSDITQERGNAYCFMNVGKYFERIIQSIDFLYYKLLKLSEDEKNLQEIVFWKNLLISRAIENMSYCIGVNIVGSDPENKYNGYSCIINPNGEHCVDMTEDEAVIYYQLNKSDINSTMKLIMSLDESLAMKLNYLIEFLKIMKQ